MRAPLVIIAPMLTSADLRDFIDKHGIPARIVLPSSATPTVPAAAEAMGVSPEAIIKSVLFIIQGSQPLLVIANGERLISQRSLADQLAVGKRQVKIARPEQVLNWTGYPVGGVPPFGHLKPLPTWIDPGVLEQEIIYGGGGESAALIQMRVADLVPLTNAQVIQVCD